MKPKGLTNRLRLTVQVLGRRGSRLVADASQVEKKTDPATGLVLFPISGVFTDPKAVFLGFGKPNTYLVVPRASGNPKGEGWDKFAAFMFWRKRSFVANTKGRVQAGILFELVDLDEQIVERLRAAMIRFSNVRGASCAHTNARVLDTAGFTCGGKKLTRVYRPSKLASLLWRHGLEVDGKSVQLRVIQTNESVADHFVSVWFREFTSFCRTVKKKFHKSTDDTPAPVFEVTAAPTIDLNLPQGGPEISVGISRPSFIGAYLSFILGQHPIFVGSPRVKFTAPELTTRLKPFPGKLDAVTKLKKHVLFSKITVRLMRRHLMAAVEYHPGMPAQSVVEMLRPSTGPSPEEAFRYNVVLTGDNFYLTRLQKATGRDHPRVNWLLAKHVLIAGYDPDVLFAGEVWRHVGEDGRSTLYVTADSGTYKPGPERLEPAVQAISGALGVPVQGITTR